MTKHEIIKRLEELDRQEFMVLMIDHWTWEDQEQMRQIKNEQTQLKKMLEEMAD